MGRMPPKAGNRASYADYPPQFIGGTPCLDFVNTSENRLAPVHRQRERLVSYGELLLWARARQLISADEQADLRRQAHANPEKAALTLHAARVLRETIAIAADNLRQSRPVDVSLLNQWLTSRSPPRLHRDSDGSPKWDLGSHRTLMENILWPIVFDAANLLVSDHRTRIRMCSDDTCGWMFLDMSRAGNRRWCSMSDCGNRDKARRHRAQTQTG
jgi:predicted RNA-binding Zn ribbon-like protein